MNLLNYAGDEISETLGFHAALAFSDTYENMYNPKPVENFIALRPIHRLNSTAEAPGIEEFLAAQQEIVRRSGAKLEWATERPDHSNNFTLYSTGLYDPERFSFWPAPLLLLGRYSLDYGGTLRTNLAASTINRAEETNLLKQLDH